jgi:hypothetical protein
MLLPRTAFTCSLLLGLLWLGSLTLTPRAAHAQTPAATVEASNDATLMTLFDDGGFAVFGESGTGAIPAEGAGARMMWYPAMGAFRAGSVDGAQWNGANIGAGSVAFGVGTTASGNYATAMGFRTTASGDYATAMGFRTTASGDYATAVGDNTTASGRSSNAMGKLTTASGPDATAMGDRTTASGPGATAMGDNTTASGNEATAMGELTTASGDISTAMGTKAQAIHENTFVWGDRTFADFTSTGPDQFLIRAGGGMGVGTNSPQTQFDVKRDIVGSAAPENHVAFFENTASTNGGDVLALQLNSSDPDALSNFITFRDGDGAVGAIEGTSGGVTLTSGNADFAELLPRQHPIEPIDDGEVVGIVGGAVTTATAGAARVAVVTDRPAVLGNNPGPGERSRYEAVSFIGQVPVETRGPVAAGDLLVPSGTGDGTARAVAPSDYAPQVHGPVVGQAWAASEGGTRRVNAAIGPASEVAGLRSVAKRQQDQINKQQTEIDALEARLSALETERSHPLATSGPTGGWLLAGCVLIGGLLAGHRRWAG